MKIDFLLLEKVEVPVWVLVRAYDLILDFFEGPGVVDCLDVVIDFELVHNLFSI